MGLGLLVALLSLGGSAVNGQDLQWRRLDLAVEGWDWDLVAWELDAVVEKAKAEFAQPIRDLENSARVRIIDDYLEAARTIGDLERRINAIYAQAGGQGTPEVRTLETRLTLLREHQAMVRPAVEQIIEDQVGYVVANEGIELAGRPVPPVLFTFTEPPKKLVVSPRDRIASVYYSMLEPTLPASEREEIEKTIAEERNFSAYVADIGGLGAFPTQVIDQAPLDWVLSTVAHEWVHNYLTLFPLGLNYSKNSELTILNETVAEIAGEELGGKALQAYYPETAAASQAPAPEEAVAAPAPPSFDFRKEMRHTREVVDQFLAWGRVEDAERYMEIRRLLFLENGYNIRKLNQAYFAFHGSYGTGAAATSPIGPKLEKLRELSPDLKTFLETVRWFTSAQDLDQALERTGLQPQELTPPAGSQ